MYKLSYDRVAEIRRHITCGLTGLFVASFVTHIRLFSVYIATRPVNPDKGHGFIYPLNNHGTYYYLSAVESASVNLAFWCGWLAIMLAFVVAPKKFIPAPANTPKWIMHVSASWKTGLEEFSIGYFITIVSAFVISIATFLLLGGRLTQLLAPFVVS